MCILHIMIDILDSLFAPLARLLVARGVLFPELSERLKAHYIRAAEGMTDGKTTDSRLSVLTGLQRRDVARLRQFSPKEQRPNHLVRLVALWQTEPGYQITGKPRELPKNGPAPSFEALARMVRRDVHPRTMLDTLGATDTIAFDPESQTVQLTKTSYQPLSGSEDQIAYLASNLGDHVNAATENVLDDKPRHFERAVHYSGLSDDDIAKLDTEYRAEQMALFEKISKKAAALQKNASGKASCRFRAGGYFYHTDEGSS